MKEAELVKGAYVSGWGWYIQVKCDNCGKMNGVWAYTEYVATDCECSLWEGKGKWRTEAHFAIPESKITNQLHQ